ncbi:Ni/Fe-hydrogenase, b-type cytochrome subunit [Acidiphilium sp.]|uniref:Ni/Fe-hydrogenase, b-type cytochrome subunit n=1 Tax=Acidiphilium TaxID=522 RepID=UPI00258761B4|nr:Ni/Fe-hydrogenase, b-type cytochrome subunit [Acidiphilium sp.]
MTADTRTTPTDLAQGATARRVSAPVYVYELPVRIWHWVMALSIVILSITGFLIADPLWPLQVGQPSQHFLMGDIRTIHFITGDVFAVAMLVRIYWAIVGNRYAREIFAPAVWRRSWRREFARTIRWYLFLERETSKEIGHNPLAQLAMFAMFTLGVLFQIVTGFALFGEGTGHGTWAFALFTSWVMPLFGNSQAVHTWHHLAMWYLILFAMVHVYMSVREDIMSRQTMISTIINGWRFFKDDRE